MDHDACTTTYFTPALWKQRRSFILDVLKKNQVQKVLDYGCGEGSVLSFMIPSSATDDIHFTHLIGLDIDRDLLEQETLAACQPWPSDYEQLREAPLTVDIYCGSVDQYDARLMMSNCDAIVCSEVIEHVYPSTLDGCLPLMLGVYAPPLVIVTTPNAEYNVFFPDLKYGEPDATFRHDDHKFEWTRHEFEEWCTKGAQRYGYDVEFHGIGLLDGKHDRLEYGHCTQACIFTKQQPHKPMNPPSSSQYTSDSPHLLLKRFEFPYYNLPTLPVSDIFRHVESYISDLCQSATLKHHQQQQQQQQQQAAKQNDDGLDSLLTWSTEIYSFDDDEKTIDWNKDDMGGCATNNQTWCTDYTFDDDDDDDNRHHHSVENDDDDDDDDNDDDDDDDDSSDSSDSNHDDQEHQQRKQLWTMTPITLNVDTLWSILHIRQLCKTRQQLVEAVLPIGGDASYKVMGDQLVVHKSFLVEDPVSF